MKCLLAILIFPSLVFAQRINVVDLTNEKNTGHLVREVNQVLATLPRHPKLANIRRIRDPFYIYNISIKAVPYKYSALYKWARARHMLRSKVLFITYPYGIKWQQHAGLAAICGTMGIASNDSYIMLHEVSHLLGMEDHIPEIGIPDPVVLEEIRRCKK